MTILERWLRFALTCAFLMLYELLTNLRNEVERSLSCLRGNRDDEGDSDTRGSIFQ